MNKPLPQDWRIQTLGSIVSKSRPISYGVVQTGEFIDNGVPCVRVVDLTSKNLDPEKMIRTSEKISQSYKRTILKKNDIMFALRGEIGTVELVPDELIGANLTRGIALISPENHVLPEFLIWALRSSSVREDILKKLNGSTFKEIPLTELRKVQIVIPTFREQSKIAAILSTWDDAIALNKRLIAALQERKKGLLQRLLSREVRFPEFHGDWQETNLGQFFYPFSMKNKNNENLTILSCSTIHGIVPQTLIFNKRVASEDIRRYKVVERGDLVFDPMLLWDASIGFLEVVNRGVISPAYSTLKFIKDSANRLYFKYLLKSHYYRQNYKFISQGTNVRRRKAPVEAFLKLKVILPASIQEQNKIVEVLQTCDEEINLQSRKLEALKQQKKGLMQRLLTGEVRVKE